MFDVEYTLRHETEGYRRSSGWEPTPYWRDVNDVLIDNGGGSWQYSEDVSLTGHTGNWYLEVRVNDSYGNVYNTYGMSGERLIKVS